jgi:hypothetical protein
VFLPRLHRAAERARWFYSYSMSTAIEPVAHVLAPFRDAWVEDPNATLLARGSIEAASLLQDVSPISGPENGGTSLTVVLGGNQPANGPHQWKLGLASLMTLHCAPAVELPNADHLRCCCTPEAPSNLSRVALTLLRCARGDAGCAPAAAPVSFRYYRDPQFVRATPDRGQVLRATNRGHPTNLHPTHHNQRTYPPRPLECCAAGVGWRTHHSHRARLAGRERRGRRRSALSLRLDASGAGDGDTRQPRGPTRRGEARVHVPELPPRTSPRRRLKAEWQESPHGLRM